MSNFLKIKVTKVQINSLLQRKMEGESQNPEAHIEIANLG